LASTNFEKLSVHRPKALLIADSEEILLALTVPLQNLDLETVCADSGQRALEILETTEFAVVFIEFQMPKIDGLDILRRIRKQVLHARTPVVLLPTDDQEPELELQAYKLGATDVILRPFVPEIIQFKCKLFIELDRARRFERGEIIDWVGTCTEIEVQKNAQQEYERSVDDSPAILWITEADGTCSYLSKQWYEVTGQTKNEALGFGWLSAVHPDDREATGQEYMAANKEQRPFYFEYRLQTKAGDSRWSIGSSNPRYDSQGTYLGYAGAVFDIHEKKIAIESIKESERKLSTMANSVPQLVWSADSQGRVDYYNDRISSYFGARFEDGLWKWEALVHPEDSEKTQDRWTTAVREKSEYSCEHRIQMADGSYRWHLSRALPALNEAGELIRWYGTATDVHERKVTQEQLEQSANQLKTLANSIPQIVYISQPNGQPTFLNDRWYQYTGADRTEDFDLNDFIHPEDLSGSLDAWQNAIKTKTGFQYEMRIRGADGSYRWFIARAEPNVENGQITSWFGTSTDIHIQKLKREESEFLDRVAQTFAQGSNKIESLIDNIVSLTIQKFKGWAHVHLLEPDGRIRLVGVKHDRPEMTELSWRYDNDFPQFITDTDGLAEVIRSGKTRFTAEIPKNAYDLVPPRQRDILNSLELRSSIAVALRTTDEVFGVLTLVSNEHCFSDDEVRLAEQLAERSAYAIKTVQLLEALRNAKDEAEHANELKSAFLANMSHEIRTPLGAMIGFADLLRDTGLTRTERSNYIDVLSRNGEQLSVIINDILDLSKVEAGHLTLEFIETNACQIATDVVSLLRVKAKEKDLTLELICDPSTPQQVVTDPVRVRQVLLNLVSNAIKFTHIGAIRVKSYGIENDKGRKIACFEIEDSGIGIPSEQRDRIFEVFVQADNSMTRRFGGTGLGLALSRSLARALGGDVRIVKTVEGQGSTFLFSIEDQPSKNDAASASEREENVQRVELNEDALDGVRVLVVDDAPDNQQLIWRYLTRRGAIVESAENGLVGYRKALIGQYDVVLMDIQMPEMDGYTATQQLRYAGFRKPIIALTAHAMSEVRKKCLNVGCTDHVSKPINAKELVHAIARHMRH